jgi:hypothetical protein
MKRPTTIALRAVTAGVGALLTTLLCAPSASAGQIVRYEVIDISTISHTMNPGGPVASCQVGSDGVPCSITSGITLTTSVETSLGVSKSVVSAGIKFNLSQQSSSAVTCGSVTPKKGQTLYVYRYGTTKTYRIRRTIYGTRNQVVTSGILKAWQPDKGVHVMCFVG